MGQYHKLINITKKEYIVGHDIGINLKHYEQIGFEGSMADVLYCLMIAQGNDPRGGGDVSGHKYIGRWTGDDVAIVGDYYDDELGDNHKLSIQSLQLKNKSLKVLIVILLCGIENGDHMLTAPNLRG
mgnify:CR=1 FL=1